MAVTQVRKIPDETAGQTQQGGPTDKWVYLVQFNGLNATTDTPFAARTASDGTTSVPAYMSSHPVDSRLKLTDKQSSRTERGSLVCRVECSFSIPVFNFEAGGSGKWSKRVITRGLQTTENVNQEVNGEQVVNSFGTVYPAQIAKVFYDEEIVVEYMTDALDETGPSAHRGEINSDSVTLTVGSYSRAFAPYTLKIVDEISEMTLDADGGVAFRVQLILAYRTNLVAVYGEGSPSEHGWQRLLVDQGFYYLDDDDNTIRSDVLVHLDGTGHKLADGEDAVLIPYQFDFLTSFTTLLVGFV
jgi:hypothetical protein